METKQIFISYSSKDQDIAYKICSLLEGENMTCWIAPRDVTGGKSYGREILEAISNAQVVLFIFSENSNRSRHVENEIDNAFNAGKVIIPFKIDQTKISLELQYYLNKTHWIDGCPEPTNAIDNLKKAIKANLPQTESNDESAAEEVGKEGRYDILQNAAGEILILINYQKSEPENPRFVYDGEDSAMLYRNKESAILLDNINEAARKPLSQIEEILIVEIKDDDAAREYKVPVRHVKSLKHFL